MFTPLLLWLHLLVALLLPTGLASSRPLAVTTVYLVRHGEKDLTVPGDDQPLTAAGEARAKALAQKLGHRSLVALFTTDTRRTRATVAPLAAATGLTPLVYKAEDPAAALATRIRRDYAGKAVAVVGHSNTLLPLIAALGAQPPLASIGDAEFSYLFEVRLPASGPATVKVSHYGVKKGL